MAVGLGKLPVHIDRDRHLYRYDFAHACGAAYSLALLTCFWPMWPHIAINSFCTFCPEVPSNSPGGIHCSEMISSLVMNLFSSAN
jgi:hypothetical protein